jgi:hypothetical protein
MAQDNAYKIAELKIKEALRSGAKELDLSQPRRGSNSDKITKLPESLIKLEKLELLNLSRNQLTALPESIIKLTHLRHLNLSENPLLELPEPIAKLTQLRVLNLTGTNLTVLPETMRQNRLLEKLFLGDNRLTTLPDWLGELTALNSLYLHQNPLTHLPESLAKLVNLRGFSLRGIANVPQWLANFTSLELLALVNGDLTELPEFLVELRKLKQLYLWSNQLTTLPEWVGNLAELEDLQIFNNKLKTLPISISNLNKLKILGVSGNPLSSELLELDKANKLIDYFQELARAKRSAPDGAAFLPFNEAKLLLVGPGEVGKTWLLQALQGNAPKSKGSTKGIEISREPLELPHPTDPSRMIHLNCWDFGGQEQYQITHQIFFSAKAIYLLVWKPRVGFDPELAARLERIELSAGRTAKVFIVSTHADGNVPPVIGEHALRERFGELIQGFYAVDSKRGAEGSGIAQLKADIAKAASQLEGMDTPFPLTWRAAKAAVCTQAKKGAKTLRYSQFVDLCQAKDLKQESCESLAIVMHDFGNIVFFREAAASSDAEMKQGDNLVVLDPEWLAKAVAFVIEDQDARKHYGVLEHKRLRTIWAKDSKRKCPGYGRNLFGYLLWMMWKFDIAYKQNEHTSLVPELIQRNRPDDLRWTPLVKPQERQAALILRITQNPPQGLIPVLTAAVHPLRRIQDPSIVSDTLDRNWREGFFLDTARRGSAFVELEDRDLHIVTRDNYPADLIKLIRKTLERVVQDRWPRLPIDYHVRCIMRTDKGEPCRGTFKWDYLDTRRGKVVSCQTCNNDSVEVDKMLEGFDFNAEEIMHKLRELKDGQNELLAAAYRLYWKGLNPERTEILRAPCMFTILPEKVSNWQLIAKATESHVRVTCWCEHPDGPHPAVAIGSSEPPDYVLKITKDWFAKSAPYISWAATLLKAFVPFVNMEVMKGLDGVLSMHLKDQIDFMTEASKTIPSGKLEIAPQDELEGMHRNRPDIVTLRHIHDALLKQIPDGKRWGDLRPVPTKSGDVLWLCAKHAAIQQPPVQKI